MSPFDNCDFEVESESGISGEMNTFTNFMNISKMSNLNNPVNINKKVPIIE